jgi:hypothetical protein
MPIYIPAAIAAMMGGIAIMAQNSLNALEYMKG